MARRISTGISGKNVLGSIVAVQNSLRSVVTDEDVLIEPNGTGIIQANSHFQINDGNSLRLSDSDSSNYVALVAPATVGSNVTLTFPATAGTSGYVLATDGNGNLSWNQTVVGVNNQLSDSATYYPTLVTTTSGSIGDLSTSSTKLSYVPSTGTLTATAYVETSSITLKENINPIENALDSMLSLNGVIYDRKDGSSKNEAGLIAEQVVKVLPNLVTKDENGNPYGINYTKLSAYLIEAVKELSAQVSELKKK